MIFLRCHVYSLELKCGPALHYSVDLLVPLKYGKLATKYPWIYGHFLQCNAWRKSRFTEAPEPLPLLSCMHCEKCESEDLLTAHLITLTLTI